MKKFLILLLCAALTFSAFVLTGCRATVPRNPTHPQTESDYFKLTISVSTNVFRRGEDIKVTAVFENLSGESFEIWREVMFVIFIVVNSEAYDDTRIMPAPINDVLAAYEVRTITNNMGSLLQQRGRHELVAFASFGVIYESTENESICWGEGFFYSNTIILTVN